MQNLKELLKELKIFGIDLGNYDTKSQNTTIPSGYEGPFTSKPVMAAHYLELDGKYYTPSIDRLYYMRDKTNDERCIVLTLISIAREILLKFDKVENVSKEEIQEYISHITKIGLGAGLPVSHYKKAAIDNLIAYYEKYMKCGIDFTYDDYHFHFSLEICRIYPQGGAAAACKANKIALQYNTYYVIDIGGYTIDVAQFKNGCPEKDRISLEMGIITLYDNIVNKVFANCDINIDYDAIEAVLNNENTILAEEVKAIIREMTNNHANTILNALRQQKIMFDSHPCLFVGGGSILLKASLLRNPMIKKDAVQFISDTRANAKGYARLLKSELSA